jgi:hypothetical protein
VGTVPVGEADKAFSFVFCGAEVMRGFTVLVKVAWYLAVPAGVATMMTG